MTRVKKYYKGMIVSTSKKAPNDGKKEIRVKIEQNLWGLRVFTKTDINSSTSTLGNIVEENGQYVMYYSYLTNPKASVQKKNPIQYGTCRMIIDNAGRIEGRYWTNVETSGDIIWEACDINGWNEEL